MVIGSEFLPHSETPGWRVYLVYPVLNMAAERGTLLRVWISMDGLEALGVVDSGRHREVWVFHRHDTAEATWAGIKW